METMFKDLVPDRMKCYWQTPEILSDNVLESLYQMRARESHQLKTVLVLYEQDNEQRNTHPSYLRLKTVVKKFF